jgi:hypothetical protein
MRSWSYSLGWMIPPERQTAIDTAARSRVALSLQLPPEERAASLLQGGRPLVGETFLLIGAMVPFNEPIVLGMTRRTHVHLDAQAQAKAQERRGKVTALWCTHRAGIAVQGDAARQAVALDGLCQRGKQGLSSEIGAYFTHQQDRGHAHPQY